jgi:HEAT repeat protein
LRYLTAVILLLTLTALAYAQEQEPVKEQKVKQEEELRRQIQELKKQAETASVNGSTDEAEKLLDRMKKLEQRLQAFEQEEGHKEPAAPAIKLKPEEIARQVKRLSSRFYADRESTTRALAAAGKQAVALLEKAAASEYPLERMCAMRALCIIAPERAGELVCEAVLSDCISLRLTALNVVKSLGIKGARTLLEAVAKLPPEKRSALRPMLASACRKEVEEILNKLASSLAARGVFYGQYRELAKLGSVVEPALSSIAADPGHTFSDEAAAALGELGDKAAIPALKRAYLAGGRTTKEIAAASLHLLGEHGPRKEIESAYKKRCQEEGTESVYSSLAFFYCRTREYAKGEKTMREVIARFGGDATDFVNLACFLSSQNKVEEAFLEFVKAVEKGYNHMDWVKIDGELANLRASKRFQDYVREKFPDDFKEPDKSEEAGEDE